MKKNKEKELISIIVPCFNEQEALPIFYEEICKVFKEMNCNYELLLVNDGSKDNTLEVMKDLASKDKHVIYLSFSRNFGKESAMYAGLLNAKGDYVAIMDADMQDPPFLLPKMIQLLKQDEYDSVATRRISRSGESKIRSFFARTFYKIINIISDADIVDGARDFRLMKREMVNAIISMSEVNRFSKGIFGWVGFRTYWLPFENVERVAGSTSWSFWGLVKYAISGIINFSLTPLDISTYLGVLMGIISLIMFLLMLIIKIPIDSIFTVIMIIVFISAIQLVSMGILGQYLGKTFVEVRNRPHYIIADTNKEDSIKIG